MRIFKFGSAALVLVSTATASFATEHQQNQVKETSHSAHKVKKVKQKSAGSSGGSVDRYEAAPMSRPRCINPANGMPMIDTSGGCGGVDVTGKPYGMP